MSKHVLVISHSFPPLNNIAARRFGFLTPYLEQHGWIPWILTTESTGPLPVGIPERQVIRIGRHPQSGSRIDGQAADHCKRLSPLLRMVRALLTSTRLRFRSIDQTCLGWRREVLARSEDIRGRLPKIDVVLGTFGPAASLWLARYFAREFEVPWVADYRDLAALRHDGRPLVARYIDRLIEAHLLGNASAVTSIGRTLTDMLQRAYDKPAEVIYNGWDPNVFKAGQPHADHKSLDEERYLLYAGRFYSSQMNATRLILKALVEEPDLHLRVRSLGPENLEEELQSQARQLGVNDRMSLLPPCSPSEVAAEADRAVANLVLDDVHDTYESSRGMLTGKFLELVARPRPVLAVTQPDSEMGPILESTQKGRICSTVSEVSEFIHGASDELSRTGNAGEIDRFSKSNQAAVLAGLLDEIVSGQKGATGCLPASAEPDCLKNTGWQAASATPIGGRA